MTVKVLVGSLRTDRQILQFSTEQGIAYHQLYNIYFTFHDTIKHSALTQNNAFVKLNIIKNFFNWHFLHKLFSIKVSTLSQDSATPATNHENHWSLGVREVRPLNNPEWERCMWDEGRVTGYQQWLGHGRGGSRAITQLLDHPSLTIERWLQHSLQ